MKNRLMFKIFLCFYVGMLCFFNIKYIYVNANSITVVEPTGSGTENDPYLVGTKEELYWIAQNTGSNQWYIELTDNITINEKVLDSEGNLATDTSGFINWKSIGNKYNAYIDGKGFTISGIYFIASDRFYGFIGPADGGYVRNLNIVDSYFISSNGLGYLGAITGYGNVEIDNCHISATVISSTTSGKYIGGIAGYSENIVKNCSFSGIVQGYNYVGGIVGTGNVQNSYNLGSVNGQTSVGGIAGQLYCGTINNCYNIGNLTGTSKIGGLVGDAVSATVSNSYSVGIINETGYSNISGTTDVSVTNSYYLSDTSGTQNKTIDQFKSGEITYLLNGSTSDGDLIWKQNIDMDSLDDYPNFNSNIVYYVQLNCTNYGYSNYNESKSDTHIDEYIYVVNQNDDTIHDVYYSCHSKVYVASEEHVFSENGICICGKGIPAELIENGEFTGYYEIKTAGNLYWFSEQVNNGNVEYNAVLANDIVINENVIVNGELSNDVSEFIEWIPISDADNRYSGIFDGNGYCISGLYKTTIVGHGYAGLFLFIGENAQVKNLGVVDSYISSSQYIGGITSFNFGLISNCYFSGIINTQYSISGGIASDNSGKILNSYNHGKIVGYAQIAGIVGANYAEIVNCYNIGEIDGKYYAGPISGYGDGTISNSYYLDDSESESGGKTLEQFASGEVAYLLSDPFGQQLTGDNQEIYPVLNGEKVYRGYKTCMDTIYTYTNDENEVYEIKPCDFGDGTLEECLNGCGNKNFGLVTIVTDIPTNGYTFSGDTYEPTFTLKFLNEELEENVHYLVSGIVSHSLPGTYNVKFTPTTDSGYSGEIIYNWTINKFVLEFDWYDYQNLIYNGSTDEEVISAVVTNKLDNYPVYFYLSGHLGSDAKDYTAKVILYEETALYYTLEGSATATLDWSISPAEINKDMFQIGGATYDGESKKLISAYFYSLNGNQVLLVSGRDYTVTYSDNINAGICDITISGIGNYTGTINTTSTIKKADLSVTIHNQSMNHYSDFPEFTYEVSGFIGDDTFIVEPNLTVDTDGKTEGEFTIFGNDAVTSENYNITYIPGILTVFMEHNYENCQCICGQKNHQTNLFEYENGICVNGCYEEPLLIDDYYQIDNAGKLMWFSEQANLVNNINCILLSDIDMTSIVWKPFGNSSTNKYQGIFNGNYYSIKNINKDTNQNEGSRCSFTYYLGEDGVIMNTVFDNANVFTQGHANASAVVTLINFGLISNVIVENSLIQLGAYAYLSGLVGVNESTGIIEYSAVVNTSINRRFGKTDKRAAIVNLNNGIVRNCYSYGCSFNNDNELNGAIICAGNNPENCYYYIDEIILNDYGLPMSKEQFAAGEVTYFLNNNKQGIWKQTLNVDEYPLFKGEDVYYGYITCADNASMVYSNNSSSSIEQQLHCDDNKDHICDNNCGKNDINIELHLDDSKDHICDYGCSTLFGTCQDLDKDHICDYGCSTLFGTCQDLNKDHLCDYGCSTLFGICEDVNKDHVCDYDCNKIYGEHTDNEDSNHLCDYGCENVADDGCYDNDDDGICDECGKDISVHKSSIATIIVIIIIGVGVSGSLFLLYWFIIKKRMKLK